MSEERFLGVDVGSVSTNLVLTDLGDNVIKKVYIRNNGAPTESVVKGLGLLELSKTDNICGVGATGSGRFLASLIVGADVVKNEITAHGVAALSVCPEVKTVIEIGGQDSKIIFFENGIITDFNMNTVCAAGTGSFLDRTAGRLGVDVKEIGALAKKSENGVRIAGRCAVFAESDMIHKQQTGCKTEDILKGLCTALTKGYLNNLTKGKKIKPPVLFQGGVAANEGIRKSFEKELGMAVSVSHNYDVMGALGAAILARENYQSGAKTKFRKTFAECDDWTIESSFCGDCPNNCTVFIMKCDGEVIGSWGARCGKSAVKMC